MDRDLAIKAKATNMANQKTIELGSIRTMQEEGGDNDAANGPMHAYMDEDGEDGVEQVAPAPRKRDARKIPRYESASIDEEEFQDCK